MSKIILSGHIIVPVGDLEAVSNELPEHIENTRSEPGCLVFEVKQDRDDPTIFTVYEEFADRGSFERHQERVRSSTWGQVTANVQRHYELAEASGDI